MQLRSLKDIDYIMLYRVKKFIPLAKKHKKYKRLELYKHKTLAKLTSTANRKHENYRQKTT